MFLLYVRYSQAQWLPDDIVQDQHDATLCVMHFFYYETVHFSTYIIGPYEFD
jgi:hypothetical protein